MTVPFQYAHASEQFDRFLEAARVALDHETSHQAYQTVEGLLRVFRRRLSVAEGLAFADALPAVLRAIFVADWDIEAPVLPFAGSEALGRELQAYRPHHNLTPPDAIARLAPLVRAATDPVQFDRVLRRLPAGARDFWGGED